MISTDKNILTEGSTVRERMKELAELVECLHIIVFAPHAFGGLVVRERNMFICPTNSFSRWLYVFDALRIGKRVIMKWKMEIKNSYNPHWLITCQDPFETGLVGVLLKKKFRIPLQIQIHTDFLDPYFSKQSLLNHARVYIARFCLKRTDCVRTVSKRITDSLKKLRITANGLQLPICTDVDIFQKSDLRSAKALRMKYPNFDFIVLMVARLSPEKNIPLALSVMHKVIQKHPRAGFIIVGSGQELEKCLLLVNRYSLQNNVIFKPQVSRDELSAYYHMADILFLSSNYEGYGLVLVEATVSGLPIITSDVGIASELIKDGESGFICPVGDMDCMVNRINKLIENDLLRKNFTSLARSRAESLLVAKAEYLSKTKEGWEKCTK
jgi:1,2-diacylglycerol 3-alpha-glucosyltransferase